VCTAYLFCSSFSCSFRSAQLTAWATNTNQAGSKHSETTRDSTYFYYIDTRQVRLLQRHTTTDPRVHKTTAGNLFLRALQLRFAHLAHVPYVLFTTTLSQGHVIHVARRLQPRVVIRAAPCAHWDGTRHHEVTTSVKRIGKQTPGDTSERTRDPYCV